jgi:hypothetical protein
MIVRSHYSFIPVLSVVLGLAACSGESPSDSGTAVNVNPSTLDEVTDSVSQIDAIYKRDPQAARVALDKLQVKVDELNHLVARVEASPGHYVGFYELEPGNIGISEQHPVGSKAILASSDIEASTSAELYRRLAHAEPPQSLLDVEEREKQVRDATRAISTSPTSVERSSSGDGYDFTQRGSEVENPGGEAVGAVQQAWTASQGPQWRDQQCFKGGDRRECLPNWSGGRYQISNTRVTFVKIAPFSGDVLNVRFQMDGTTKWNNPAFPGEQWNWWAHSGTEKWSGCCWLCACGYWDYSIQNHRWDVLNATGDGFHWTYKSNWTCSPTFNCESWN